MSIAERAPVTLPVLPLRDVVVYPHMVIPLFVGREKSMRALDVAMANNKQILLVAQKSAEVDDPGAADIYSIGTLATILQLHKSSDGNIRVLVDGTQRAQIDHLTVDQNTGFLNAQISLLGEGVSADDREIKVMMRTLLGLFGQYMKLNEKVSQEILSSLGVSIIHHV